MWCSIYNFSRDQGSIIAGLMALCAAWIAYRGATTAADRQVAAAQGQVAAAEAQTAYLQHETRRDIARRSMISVNMLFGVLIKLQADIIRLERIVDEPPYSIGKTAVPAPLLKCVRLPDLEIVWGELGRFDQTFVFELPDFRCKAF